MVRITGDKALVLVLQDEKCGGKFSSCKSGTTWYKAKPKIKVCLPSKHFRGLVPPKLWNREERKELCREVTMHQRAQESKAWINNVWFGLAKLKCKVILNCRCPQAPSRSKHTASLRSHPTSSRRRRVLPAVILKRRCTANSHTYRETDPKPETADRNELAKISSTGISEVRYKIAVLKMFK